MYSWKVDGEALKNVRNLWYSGSAEASSNINAVTAVVNHKGLLKRWINPNAAGIELSIMELLDLAGMTGNLDTQQESLGPNSLRSSGGPARRITGLDLHVVLTCYEPAEVPAPYVHQRGQSVCTVTPHLASPMWVSHKSWDSDGSEQHVVRRHGIRVTIATKMYVSRLNLETFMSWLVKTVVLVGVPKLLCSVLLVCFCGRVSELYQRAIREPFHLADHMCELVMNVLVRSVTFHVLKDSKDNLSFERLSKVLDENISWPEGMSKAPLHALATLVTAYVRKEDSFTQWRRERDDVAGVVAARLVGKRKRDKTELLNWLTSNSADGIDVSTFVQASCASHEVSLQCLLHVVENQDSLSLREKVVVPWSVRKLFELSHQQARSISEVPHQSAGQQVMDVEDKLVELQRQVEQLRSDCEKRFMCIDKLLEQSILAKVGQNHQALVQEADGPRETLCAQVEKLRQQLDNHIEFISNHIKEFETANAKSTTAAVKQLEGIQTAFLYLCGPSDGLPERQAWPSHLERGLRNSHAEELDEVIGLHFETTEKALHQASSSRQATEPVETFRRKPSETFRGTSANLGSIPSLVPCSDRLWEQP